jgi:hypothetical protein
MIPVTAAMKDGALRTHAPRWLLATDDGQDWTGMVLDGSLTRSSGRSPRSRLRLTLAGGSPRLLDQGLLPTGRDLILSYSQRPATEVIALFTGRLVQSGLTRTESTWDMEAVDHSSTVAADLIAPGGITVPATVGALVQALVRRTLPDALFTITGPAATAPVPSDLEVDGDPWQIIEKACQSCGCEAWFDQNGRCVVRAEPALAAPVDALRVGSNVTGYQIGHEAAYSRVELRYKDKSTPPNTRTGVWQDLRADSPTSVARIGRVTLREDDDSALYPSQAQADAAAAALAGRAAGRARRAVVRHVPRPWLEPGDSIEITLAGGPTETQMIESVEVPIGPGVQITTMRNTGYRIEAA